MQSPEEALEILIREAEAVTREHLARMRRRHEARGTK